jgi:hypothetical protein
LREHPEQKFGAFENVLGMRIVRRKMSLLSSQCVVTYDYARADESISTIEDNAVFNRGKQRRVDLIK